MWYSVFESTQIIRILLLCDNAKMIREHQFQGQIKVTSLLGSIRSQQANCDGTPIYPKDPLSAKGLMKTFKCFVNQKACDDFVFIIVATSSTLRTFYFR